MCLDACGTRCPRRDRAGKCPGHALPEAWIGWMAYGIVQHVGLSNYGFKIGALLPVFILLFNLLAYGSIKSDEKLVRSMDRLR